MKNYKQIPIALFLIVVSVFITIGLSLRLDNVFADEAANEPVSDIYNEDYKIRLQAVKQLAETKPMNEEVVTLLAEALNDKSDSVKMEALRSIILLGPEAKDAFPKINSIIKDNSVRDIIRYSFLLELPKLKDNSSFFIPSLLEILDDEDTPEHLKVYVIDVIRVFREPKSEVLTKLETLTNTSQNEVIQFKAWEALAFLDTENKEAISKLVETAQDKSAVKIPLKLDGVGGSYFLPTKALYSLVELEKYDLALPIIVENLFSDDEKLRGSSPSLLQKIGKNAKENAKEYIPQIIVALKTESIKSDGFAKMLIIGSLVSIDPNSELVRETLEEIASRDPEPGIRKYAARFLTTFKVIERNPDAIGELIDEFNQTDIPFYKLQAAAALSKYGSDYDEYWDYLYQVAKASINDDIPFPGVYDEKGTLISDEYSDKFLEWCKTNNCDKKKVFSEIRINSVSVYILSLTADERAYNLLLDGLESDNFKIVISSVSGLVYFNNPNSVAPILKAIKKLPHGMQQNFKKGLHNKDNEIAQNIYEQLVQDMDEEEITDQNSNLDLE